MLVSSPQLTVIQVLQTFREDELYLFFGAAFITFGVISATFAFWGRKMDRMLLWLGVFAALYGLRMWIQLDFVVLLTPSTVFFHRLRLAMNYLVPIPAF